MHEGRVMKNEYEIMQQIKEYQQEIKNNEKIYADKIKNNLAQEIALNKELLELNILLFHKINLLLDVLNYDIYEEGE